MRPKPFLPLVAITMGDPAGIGPEIIVKALSDPVPVSPFRPLVIGDCNVLQQAKELCQSKLEIVSLDNLDQASFSPGIVNVLDLKNVPLAELKVGKLQAINGKSAYEYIVRATELAMEKKVDAIVTAPINKEALRMAGVPHIGHTEIFEALTHQSPLLTLFETKGIRTFFHSRHVSLKEAIGLITKEKILSSIIRCVKAMKDFGIDEGPLAVAALNPHGGENGLIGSEEVTEITPAIEEAKRLGYNVVGPISADSIFYLAQKKQFSAILSLYHDQGHIGMKTLDFERTVALTLGMPFLRASVDHGTAYDIAGRAIASEISLKEALLVTATYLKRSK